MPSARRAETAVLLAGSVLRRRYGVTSQQHAALVMQFQGLLRQADADTHEGMVQATKVDLRRAAKNPDSRLPHCSASTPPTTDV